MPTLPKMDVNWYRGKRKQLWSFSRTALWHTPGLLPSRCGLSWSATPILFALFSIVAVLALRLSQGNHTPVPVTAWYHKAQSTFVDCLASVCRHLWRIRDQAFTTHNTGALKGLGYRFGRPCDDRGQTGCRRIEATAVVDPICEPPYT
jgi:hypothetical protein